MQEEAGLPFRNPSLVRDIWGAFGASLQGYRPGLAISGEEGLRRPGRARAMGRAGTSFMVPPGMRG
jgi:hypothetical protein